MRQAALYSGILLLVALIPALPGCGPSRDKRGMLQVMPSLQAIAQIAVDDPCQYLGSVHKVSRILVDRLRADKEITLDEFACMADVIVDANWEVGIHCHDRTVKFEEFAQRQKEGHRECVGGKRAVVERCAVIRVNALGRARLCR